MPSAARFGDDEMNLPEEPLVNVLTPIGIESVLRQSHSNWECVIVNNCGSDGALEIVERCARQDERAEVYNNEVLPDVIANHKRAFRLTSAPSKYCKVVSVDDWMFSESLDRTASPAEPIVHIKAGMKFADLERKKLSLLRRTGLPEPRGTTAISSGTPEPDRKE
jgi:glycosyltransferase involved in cell wall biosynthesis